MLAWSGFSYARGRFTMKLEIGKEWCIRMARIEGDAEIGAGRHTDVGNDS